MSQIHNWKSIAAVGGAIGLLIVGIAVLLSDNQQRTKPVVSAPTMPITSSPTTASIFATVTASSTNNFVAYPDVGTNYHPIPLQQWADCRSGKPVIDIEGNPSAASESATHVYDPFCFVLPEADPKTFVALDYYYGKDANGVWILDATGATDDGQLASEQLIGADPATFTLIPDLEDVGNNNGYENEAFSVMYTKDSKHVYYYDTPVLGADPSTFTIHDPPLRLGSCFYDANDASNKYYYGRLVWC